MEEITIQMLAITVLYNFFAWGAKVSFTSFKGAREWILALSSLIFGGLIAAAGWLLFFGYRQLLFGTQDLWPPGLQILFVWAFVFFWSFWLARQFIWPTSFLPINQIIISTFWLGLAAGTTVGFSCLLSVFSKTLLISWATSALFCAAGVRLLYWIYA